MKSKIEQKLRAIEKEKNIKILYACETGSRAWGFASPDSDFDVRFIYAHSPEWYLSIKEEKDTIEWMSEDKELDLNGWDLRKTLRLLMKSNASVFEKMQSPMPYIKYDQFLTEFQKVALGCYSPVSVMYHYLSMSKNKLSVIVEKESYRLKDLFYALRAASACKWILTNSIPPPIEFMKVLNGIEIGISLKSRIVELIDFKSTKGEAYLHKGESDLVSFIKEAIDESGKGVISLSVNKHDLNQLNQFFFQTIKEFKWN